MYTKFDLVRACLRAIGNEMPEDLEFPDLDESIAIVTVDETMIDVLSSGWWFNTEEHWKLAPNNLGEIFIPDGIIDLRTSRTSRAHKLVKRGGKLYDMNSHTFDMTENLLNDGTIDLDFLMALELTDCPVVAQQYIREKSIGKFLVDLEADQLKIAKSDERSLAFLSKLERQHYRNSKFNVYQHSRVGAILGGMSSLNSFAGFTGNDLGGGSDL